MSRRPIIAFFLAPGACPALWAAIEFLSAPKGGFNLTGFLFLGTFTYAAELVIGLPMYLILRRKGLTRWWHLVLTGTVAGVIPSVVFTFGKVSIWSLFYVGLAALTGACLGAATGYIFWLIAHAGESSRHTPNPPLNSDPTATVC